MFGLWVRARGRRALRATVILAVSVAVGAAAGALAVTLWGDQWDGAAWSVVAIATIVLGLMIVARALFWLAARRDAARARAAHEGFETWAGQRGFVAYDRARVLVTLARPFGLAGRHEVLRSYIQHDGQRPVLAMHYRAIPGEEDEPDRSFDFTVIAAGSSVTDGATTVVPQVGVEAAKVALGARDLDVESAQFNDRWRVVAGDNERSHAFLQPRIIESFVDAPPGGYTVAWTAGAVMLVENRFINDDSELNERVRLVTEVAQRTPAFLHDRTTDLRMATVPATKGLAGWWWYAGLPLLVVGAFAGEARWGLPLWLVWLLGFAPLLYVPVVAASHEVKRQRERLAWLRHEVSG